MSMLPSKSSIFKNSPLSKWITISLSLLGICLFYSFTESNHLYYFKVPVLLIKNTPSVEVVVQNKRYPLLLDTGAPCALSLDTNILDTLKTKKRGTARWINIQGNKKESSEYLLSKVSLGNLVWKKVVAIEGRVDPDCELSGRSLSTERAELAGVLGCNLLDQQSFLIDFSKKTLLFTNDLKRLEKEGYSLKEMTKVPAHLTKNGIVIPIKIEEKALNFFLDTEASHTLLNQRSSSKRSSTRSFETIKPFHFSIGNRNYTLQESFLFELPQEMHAFDGILGIDFLKEHVMYLDVEHQIAYFY